MAPSTFSATNFKPARINLRPSEEDRNEIRTVPELIDYNAEHNADQLFCLQATKETPKAKPVAITHAQLKRAILRCSTRLVTEIAELKQPYKNDEGRFVKCQPVALFVESDVGLLIHLFALMSLGVPVALLSARLSSTAVNHLLHETCATAVITSPRLSNVISKASAQSTSHSLSPATPAVYLQKPYEEDLQIDFSYHGAEGAICSPYHFISEMDRDVLILHSSGTTGLPKPIYQPHRYLLGYTVCHQYSPHEEIGGLNMSTLPLYHGFGLLAACLSLGVGKPFWLASAHVVPTGASTVKALKASGAQSLMTVPLILEEISSLPKDQGVNALLPLQFVACGGGPLKVSVGERLAAAGVKVLSHFGATEVGPMAPIFAPTLDYDWNYFRLRQDMGFDLEAIDSAGVENVQHFKLTAHPFGWEKSFELQDRLVNSLKHHNTDFKAVGRNDDLIVLATGEKVLPRILESLLSESPLVKAAVAFGDGQFELGVIVEPVSPTEDHERFKSSIWPIIVEACDQMDDHARISSTTNIIVTPQGRSIPRSDKGSVLRKEASRLFEAEIRKVYHDLDNPGLETSTSLLVEQNLEQCLKEMIQVNLNWTVPIQDWTFEDDLFELGMNSLQAVRLRRLLLSSIPHNNAILLSAERISIEFVYNNPSVAKMAQALRDNGDLEEAQIDLGHTIEDFANLYSLEQSSSPDLEQGAGSVVLLTGSTGSLGTHLLAHLASLLTVARVVCLNRMPLDARYHHEDAYERQLKSAETKGVTIPLQDRSKIEIVLIDPAAPHLGLQDAEYARLCKYTTHIMHCAWPMDFKRQLPSFQNQFRFLQSLLALAKDAHDLRPLLKPRLLFISSIAVVGQYALVHGTRMIPEVAIHNPNCTNPFGYGQAKLICERIVENAARTHQDSIEASCVRIGQMSGSQKTGFWNANEHFPTLIQLSQKVSCLPEINGTLSWLPVDLTAASLSEILLTPHPLNLIYHLENPVRQSWHDMLTILASDLGISSEFLPFGKWLDRIGASAADTDDSAADGAKREARALTNGTSAVPVAHKHNSPSPQTTPHMLADFFRHDFQHMAGGDVILDTAGARRVSATLRNSDAVKADAAKRYMEGWRRMGILK